MDCETSRRANQEWKKNFSFLKITGLEFLYLGILAMATSKRNVFHLHSLLQPEEQIFKDDLIKLANFWEQNIKTSDPHQTSKDWLFGGLANGSNNTRYYLDYIASKGLELRVDEEQNFVHGKLILSSTGRERYGTIHYVISLQSLKSNNCIELGLECYLSENEECIIVRLVTYQNNLNEPWSYFLSNLPSYVIRSTLIGERGKEIGLTYSLPAAGLKDKLILCVNSSSPRLEYYIGELNFLVELQIRLKNYGIPAESIIPIPEFHKFK